MGFLDNIRMNTMFPPSQGLGIHNIPQGPDPYQQVLNDFDTRTQNTFNPIQPPRLNQFADSMIDSPNSNQSAKPMNMVMGGNIGGMTEYQQQSLAQRKAEANARDANQDATRAISQGRLGLSELRQRHPNKRFTAVRGGNIMVFDPLTGSFEDSGINSGTLTAAEQNEILDTRQETGISQRTAGQIEAERVRQQGRSTLQEDAQAHGKEIETIREGGRIKLRNIPQATTPSATQERTATVSRAQEFINRYPDAAEWVSIDPATGTVMVAPEGKPNWRGKMDGPTAEQRKVIMDGIYNQSNNQPNPSYFGQPGAPIGTPTNTIPNNSTTPGSQVPPKVGDTKTFPNGNTGTFDGNGWVQASPTSPSANPVSPTLTGVPTNATPSLPIKVPPTSNISILSPSQDSFNPTRDAWLNRNRSLDPPIIPQSLKDIGKNIYRDMTVGAPRRTPAKK